MELTPFSVKTRSESGKGHSGRSRVAGNVPGIVYGGGQENVSIIVDKKTFDHLIHGGQGEHSLVDLQVEEDSALNGPAIVKDVQHHPVSGHVLHFDLMRIDLEKKIQTQIQIVLTGHSKGIVNGGVLDHQLRELEIECLPLDVPTEIEGDITELDIGETFHVSDLQKDDKITFLTSDERAIAAIHQPRVAKEAKADEDAAEAEAADAAAAAADADED